MDSKSLWNTKSSAGAKPKFKNQEQLWKSACEYFQWVQETPLFDNRIAQKKGEPVVVPLPKLRAMTIKGLCLFLDIGYSTWNDYTKKEQFSEVTRKITMIIETQKFEGACAGLFNPRIIARDLGLADKREVVQEYMSHEDTLRELRD